MEGGRVSYSWCMCVVGYGHGGFGEGKDGGGGWYACGWKKGGLLVVCREMPEHFSRAKWSGTDDNRSHRRPGAQLWVGSNWNWSTFIGRP